MWLVKTAIFDISTNWGDRFGLRSIDFYKDGVKYELGPSDFTARATSSSGSLYQPSNAFDTSLSKVGSMTEVSWLSGTTDGPPQRVSCEFNTAIEVDEIRVNNLHHSGDYTHWGCKDVKISLSGDSVSSVAFEESVPNKLHELSVIFNEHVSSDVEDEQALSLLVTSLVTLTHQGNLRGIFNPYVALGIGVVHNHATNKIYSKYELPSISSTFSLQDLVGEVTSFGIKHEYNVAVGMYRSVAPNTKSFGYRFVVDGVALSAITAWISEKEAGLAHVDVRIISIETPDLIGQNLTVFLLGYDPSGGIIAKDIMNVFEITHVTEKGPQTFSIEGLSYYTPRPSATIYPEGILAETESTNGKKTARFPAVWLVAIGDTVVGDGGNILVKRSTLTLRDNYRVVDITGV